MKNIVNRIKRKISEFLFGRRVKGEPINLRYPSPHKPLPKLDRYFFEWSREYRVGCLAKSTVVGLIK